MEKANIDKVLANAEIKTMINAFGCGFSEGYGNDFDITKLRYDKIVIMADADVDGAHISTRFILRVSGFKVVSQSCWASISPRPLYLWRVKLPGL